MSQAKAAIIAAIITAFATLGASVLTVYEPLKQENASLRENSSVAEDRITELQNRLSALNTEKSELKAGYEAQIAELDAEIEKLTQQLGEPDYGNTTEPSNAQPDEPNADDDISTHDSEGTTAETAEVNSQIRNGKPDAWLSDLDYFDVSGLWSIGQVTKDNWGNDHSHSIDRTADNWGNQGDAFRVYNLNSAYTSLTGVFFQQYDERSAGGTTTLSFYDYEKEELLWQGVVGRAIDPVSFDFSIAGVNKLKLEVIGRDAYRTSLGEVGLWKS